MKSLIFQLFKVLFSLLRVRQTVQQRDHKSTRLPMVIKIFINKNI